jgi:hypothetical protein
MVVETKVVQTATVMVHGNVEIATAMVTFIVMIAKELEKQKVKMVQKNVMNVVDLVEKIATDVKTVQ